MRRICTMLVAAGFSVLVPVSTWADSGLQPAYGTFFLTAPPTVVSTSTADGNIVVVVKFNGMTTGTFEGPFTETDREVIHPDGSVTLEGKGVQSGRLGTCGSGSVPYEGEATGTIGSLIGRVQTMDQASRTSNSMQIHSVYTFMVPNTATGLGTYTGTYHCT